MNWAPTIILAALALGILWLTSEVRARAFYRRNRRRRGQ